MHPALASLLRRTLAALVACAVALDAAGRALLNNWRNEPAPVAQAQASRADAAIRDAAVAWNQMIADLNGWREGGSR